MKKPPAPGQRVSIDIDGVMHHGIYSVSSKMITVTNGFGSKTTQVGSTPPDLLAKMLLRELIGEQKI